MVALDNSALMGRSPNLRFPHVPLAAIVGGAAVALMLGTQMAMGFSDNGFRLASQNAWRFTALAFFFALSAGPVCRLFGKCVSTRQMIWGFCASYAVYLASVLAAPNMHLTPDLMLFAAFGGGVTLIMAVTADPRAGAMMGEATRRTLLGVAAIFFWLCYALMGLAHLSGPHRPDAYFGISLSLMILALLLRFADRMRARFTKAPDAA